MDERAYLGELLEMETFWSKHYVAPQLRSQIEGAAIWLAIVGLLNFGVGFSWIRDSATPAFSPFLYLNACLSMILGMFSALVISMSYARPVARVKSGGQSIVDNVESSLFKDIRDLSARMACSTPFVILFESRTGSCIPSVLKLPHGKYGVVVPAGLMRRKREERRALLAHEIAHIKQDDIELWLACDRLAAGLRVVAITLLSVMVISWVACLGATIVYGIVHGLGVIPTLGLLVRFIIVRMIMSDLLYGFMLFQIAILRRRVKEFKQYSEIRADFAAIVHADGTQLRSALSFLAANAVHRNTTEDDDHLPDSDRLELVDNTIRYWDARTRVAMPCPGGPYPYR